MLILASKNSDVAEFSKYFLQPPERTKVLRVTTAGRDVPDATYLERGMEDWTQLGIELTDYDIKGKDQDEIRQALKGKNAVFVAGGNGFHLLKAIRESGFEEVVREFLDQGGTYIGASSGAYVAGPSIEQHALLKPEWNTVGLTDFTAMKLVPFMVKCHATKEKLSRYRELFKNLKHPIRFLQDGQFFVVNREGKVERHGQGVELQ